MSTTTKTVGKVSVVPKGTWAAGTSYSRLDVVSYEGSSYIAAQDAPAGVSLANTSYWQMIASIGSPAPSAEVAAAAISATESWLAANISNPTSPVIDSTLNITNAAAQAKKTGLMTAPYFSSTASYEVGDFVNYQGTLYKCNTAIPNGMAWNGIYWTATSIGNEVSDLKNDLDVLNQGGLVLEENFIAQEISDWLDDHPEATTTVEDESLMWNKLVKGTLGYVTPEMFGAVGDGETDDSAAFVSAIATGKTVKLNYGKTYLITQTLTLTEGTQLVGDGKSKLLWSTQNASRAKISASGEDNIRLEGIIFDFGTQIYDDKDITITDATNLKVINCTFLNSYGSVFRITNMSYSLIEGCHFENVTGVAGNPGECIYGMNFHDIVIHGCTCNHVGDHFLYADGVGGIYNVTVSDCIFNDTGNNEITTGGAICLYNNAYNITVANCAFKTHGVGVYIGAHATPLIAAHDVTVSGCSFDGGIFGIYIGGVTDNYRAKNIVISGCNFKDQIISNGNGGDAIRAIYVEHVVISDFVISGSALNGIGVDNFYDSIITNGIIKSVTNVGLILGSGRGTGTGGNVTVDNIRIYGKTDGTSSYSVYFRRGSGYTIGHIEDDGNFVNTAVYPTGYFNPTFTTGTWTPAIQSGSIVGNATFERAYYTISGGLVFAKVRIKLDSVNSGTYLVLQGLPFRMYSPGGGITVNASTGKIGNANIQDDGVSGSVLSAYFMVGQAETTAVNQVCDVWAVGQVAI